VEDERDNGEDSNRKPPETHGQKQYTDSWKGILDGWLLMFMNRIRLRNNVFCVGWSSLDSWPGNRKGYRLGKDTSRNNQSSLLSKRKPRTFK
jgi:hypothetical protein